MTSDPDDFTLDSDELSRTFFFLRMKCSSSVEWADSSELLGGPRPVYSTRSVMKSSRESSSSSFDFKILSVGRFFFLGSDRLAWGLARTLTFLAFYVAPFPYLWVPDLAITGRIGSFVLSDERWKINRD